MSLTALEQAIGHTFNNADLLRQALAHRSYQPQNAKLTGDNERLEFLGDRVLNFCVAEYLFTHLPNEQEGPLSKRHAALVRQDTLAQVARKLNMGEHLQLGRGEDATGGRDKDSILSDAVEALVAALYLDTGLDVARTFITTHLTPLLSQVEIKDPKSHLQEWLQARGQPLPEYTIAHMGGEAHARRFVIRVSTQSFGSAEGEGTSKQEAQKEAARALLAQLINKEKSHG